MKISEAPFIYGAQYYRAPTPGPECWEEDLKHMRELGFNAVKYWVQWRWSERREGEYYWDDLDRLMDLALDNGLAVTLNLILDVAPGWLFKQYPNCMMIDASGKKYRPTTNGCRQIGGYPGPCYHHSEALIARQRFVIEAVKHFAPHPALSMWDVWNEPENNLMARKPNIATMLCHCPECSGRFISYMQDKYQHINHLNEVWGRCYLDWDEVEIPLAADTINDFIDWREFHLDKLTAEANWRLATVEKYDPEHIRYLHVVANSVNIFNSVNCVDDFALAENCQVFGSTMTGNSLLCAQAVSAAPNKVFYNAEAHINFGNTGMHQRIIDMPLFLKEILPQVGWGVRGFLFWQFRPESLGIEAPAWGLIRPDGSERPVTRAAKEFWKKLEPFAPELMTCRTKIPEVGLWRGRRNELFQFSIKALEYYGKGLEQYAKTLYALNLPFRTISSAQLLKNDLDGIRLLIMPDAYFMDQDEANALDCWLRNGGVVLSEAHLAGYNGTTGRHSRVIPGCGLAESWGIYENESTSSYHLVLSDSNTGNNALSEVSGDVAKALSSSGASGAEYYPQVVPNGINGSGARRFASVSGENIQVEAMFGNKSCIVSKNIGTGKLFYSGTLLGYAAEKDDSLLRYILTKAASCANISSNIINDNIHIDYIYDDAGTLRFLLAVNLSDKPQKLEVPDGYSLSPIFFDDQDFQLSPNSSELYRVI